MRRLSQSFDEPNNNIMNDQFTSGSLQSVGIDPNIPGVSIANSIQQQIGTLNGTPCKNFSVTYFRRIERGFIRIFDSKCAIYKGPPYDFLLHLLHIFPKYALDAGAVKPIFFIYFFGARA